MVKVSHATKNDELVSSNSFSPIVPPSSCYCMVTTIRNLSKKELLPETKVYVTLSKTS